MASDLDQSQNRTELDVVNWRKSQKEYCHRLGSKKTHKPDRAHAFGVSESLYIHMYIRMSIVAVKYLVIFIFANQLGDRARFATTTPINNRCARAL